jgi:superfamily II DNA or RNA helicase
MAGQLLRPGHVVRARGESWIVQRHVTGEHGAVLEVSGRGADNRGARASFLLPFEPIEHLASPDAPRFVRPRTWRSVARSILADATSSYESLRSPVHAALTVLPFQLEPALAVVRGLASRILIADEVGLGKTVQAGLVISELLARRPDARALVVTPAGLRDQWKTELGERFALESTLLDSTAIAREAHGADNPWAVPGIVVTSLDYVKRPEVVRSLEALIWDVLVFDEAHALAGRSDRATVAAVLAHRARTLLLLTATPHSGDDEAFSRMVSIGDFSSRPPSPNASPGRAFPMLVFRRTRHDVGMTLSRRTVSLRVRPTTNESEMHRTLMAYVRLVWAQAGPVAPKPLAKAGATSSGAHLAMTILTRRACSSAWSLGRSVETRLRLLSADQRPDLLQMTLPFAPTEDDDEPIAELSWPGLSDRYEERRWLEHLLRLARLAEQHESKFAALVRLLSRTREPAILFTEYRDTLHRLEEHLRGFAPVQLHGGLTANERRHVLGQFVSGEARLLLATDAASEGLNLHHRCRLILNLELPWTPVRLEQRIGRVERIGQTKRVHAVHLLAAGTSEENSVSTLLARMRHVASVVGGMRPTPIEQPVLPAGVVIGDLRDAARSEAHVLERTRALAAGARQAPDGRPCVTTLCGSRARLENHWVYRLVLEDAESQPIWDTVIGVVDETSLVPRGSRNFRAWFGSFDHVIEPILMVASEALLGSLRSALHEPVTLAIRREHAIADHLERQRARLATSLLQPGLFDRRAERAASARNATLDEALGRCRRRLAELERYGRLSFERPSLAFGAIRR